MIKNEREKTYRSAKERFLMDQIKAFFRNELPKMFGPELRDVLAQRLLDIFDSCNRDIKTLKPGQMLWNALDKNTRGDSSDRRHVPVVLTIISEKEIDRLRNGENFSDIAEDVIARMHREAYQQGGILSARDAGLLLLRYGAWASRMRRSYEDNHDCTLPHPGVLHDMGSTVTHKGAIVRKVVFENKNPADVAADTYHSQRAVDRYLRDYHRVNNLLEEGYDEEFIHQTTQLSHNVIRQYMELAEESPEAA